MMRWLRLVWSNAFPLWKVSIQNEQRWRKKNSFTWALHEQPICLWAGTKHIYVHLPNVKKLLVVSISEMSEGLQRYCQIQHLKISNSIPNTVSSNAMCNVFFFCDTDQYILKEGVKNCLYFTPMSPHKCGVLTISNLRSLDTLRTYVSRFW